MAKREWEDAFTDGNLILRDYLAYYRTVLANQRTLLAYLRTAMAFIVAGLSFLEFFKNTPYVKIIAWIFIPLGLVTGTVGIVLFLIARNRTRKTMDIYADVPQGALKQPADTSLI
mgnify:CR=1 FL=1